MVSLTKKVSSPCVKFHTSLVGWLTADEKKSEIEKYGITS